MNTTMYRGRARQYETSPTCPGKSTIPTNSGFLVLLLAALCLVITVPSCRQPGLPGAAEYGFLWQGELSAAPSSPEKGWAYYDLSRANAYFWSGAAWLPLQQIPDPESPRISWLGSSPTSPEDPAIQSAYYDSTEARSFIWTGTTWLQLSTLSSSLNAKSLVAHGQALVLNHSLSTPGLTYTASYRDSTTVRSIEAFNAMQDDGTYAAFTMPVQLVPSIRGNGQPSIENFSAATNGSQVFVAWSNPADLHHGYCKIVDLEGALLYGPVKFTTRELNVVKTVALQNGNYAVAYTDVSGSLYLGIRDNQGGLVLSETVVDSDWVAMNEWDLAILTTGNIAISMMHGGVSDYCGRAEIFTAAGVQVIQYDFEFLDYADAHDTAIIPLADGSFAVSYKVYSASRSQAVLQRCTATGPDYGAYKHYLEPCEDAWYRIEDEGTIIGVTSDVDTSTYNDGAGSARFFIDTSAGFSYTGGALVASESFPAVDGRPYTALVLDMRSDVTWNGGEWQMLLDRDGDWTVTDYAWTVNGTTYPGAWRRHYIPLPAGRENLNGITAIGFKALSDKGTCTVWLDNIRLVQGYEPFVTGGPFHSTGTGLADGRFISFGQHEDGSMRYGLYDPAEGSVIRGILDPMSPHWYRAATLSDGTVCVAWDEEKGYYSFMELPPGGLPRIFRQRSLFEAGGNVNIAAVLPLPDREALLVYRNTWYSDFSGYNQVTMKRIGSYGIFIEEVSATTVKVWNFSGESRTLYLSVDS